MLELCVGLGVPETPGARPQWVLLGAERLHQSSSQTANERRSQTACSGGTNPTRRHLPGTLTRSPGASLPHTNPPRPLQGTRMGTRTPRAPWSQDGDRDPSSPSGQQWGQGSPAGLGQIPCQSPGTGAPLYRGAGRRPPSSPESGALPSRGARRFRLPRPPIPEAAPSRSVPSGTVPTRAVPCRELTWALPGRAGPCRAVPGRSGAGPEPPRQDGAGRGGTGRAAGPCGAPRGPAPALPPRGCWGTQGARGAQGEPRGPEVPRGSLDTTGDKLGWARSPRETQVRTGVRGVGLAHCL